MNVSKVRKKERKNRSKLRFIPNVYLDMLSNKLYMCDDDNNNLNWFINSAVKYKYAHNFMML